MSMFKEVIDLPEDDMSFRELVHFMFDGRHTHLGENVDELVSAIRIDLTKSIGALMPILQDESRLAFAGALKDVKDDWKAVPAQPTALQVVSRLAGRVFVGPELCRQPEYLRTSTVFTADAAMVRNELQQYSQILRPWAAPFLASLKRVQVHLRDARGWMDPVIAEILSRGGEKPKVVPAGNKGAWISWLLKYLPDHEKTAKKLGLIQMQVSFASLHTTTSATTNALLDLATYPQYVDGLREEIEAVLAEDPEAVDELGQLYITKTAVAKMKKLDSFLKESQRLTPLAFDGLSRRTHKSHTFSNGVKVPKGVLLTFPMYAAHQSEKNPIIGAQGVDTGSAPLHEFDGYRFARLREMPGNEAKYQATATGLGQFTFGHGPNACPGRFFALYIMKIVMIHILRNYDIRLPPEVQAAGRPRGRTAGVSNLVDSTVKIELRQRATSGAGA
ncbi:cytochrome P450 [Jackrogersella minutella]|nr:cytochrome P450 [Jackrogersella minutella]